MSQAGRFGPGGGGGGGAVDTLTGNVGGPVGPDGANNINIIGAGAITVTGNPGTNTLTITSSVASTQYFGDVGIATPAGGILNVIGGASTAGINMNTNASGNTVEIILNDSLLFPNTNASGTEGVLFWNADRFVHNFGTRNAFFGRLSGNLTLAGTDNSGVGNQSLQALTSGVGNSALGSASLRSVTSGGGNIGIGTFSLIQLTTGSSNISVGFSALSNLLTGASNLVLGDFGGQNYAAAESSNILFSNTGVLGESNTLRIGTTGVGLGQQNRAFMAGVFNTAIGATKGVVFCDNAGQLGSANGTNGQVIIGGGTGPNWASITSIDGTVTITPGPNTLNLAVTGGQAASIFDADTGSATPIAGVLNIVGGANIITSAVANTVLIAVTDSIGLPDTDASGALGTYRFNGVRFMHNRGITNTFVGPNSGTTLLTSATLNVGIGNNALAVIDTGDRNVAVGASALVVNIGGSDCVAIGSSALSQSDSNNNIAIGSDALVSLLTGTENIAIGTGAGNAYGGAESFNIVIGTTGVAAESTTIRIGAQGTHLSAFMGGIFGSSIGATNAAVFVDNTGKLGTVGGSGGSIPQFLALLPAGEGPFPSSTSTLHNLGETVVLNEIVDIGNNFFPGSGSGTPASFTAPTTGLYQFNFTAGITYSGTGGTVAKAIITTTNRTYTVNATPAQSVSPKSTSISICADMTAGDTAIFGVIVAPSALTWNIASGGSIPVAQTPFTWVSGFKIT